MLKYIFRQIVTAIIILAIMTGLYAGLLMLTGRPLR